MILMLYQKDVFREFYLPKVNNQDYPLVLDTNQFHIKESIILQLENSENKWILRDSDFYKITIDRIEKSEIFLKDGDIIYFETIYHEKIQGIVIDVEEAFRVYKKYDLSCVSRITIGKDPSSAVSYDFQELISKKHAEIRKETDGFYIDDYSANGVFINYMRVKSGTRLYFGDIINIFGLHIVFLGDVIAVNANYVNVVIDKSALKEYEHKEICRGEKIQKKRRIEEENKHYFNRSPRKIPNIHEDTVEIEAPPALRIAKKKPVIYTIGPSFTMAIPMMLGCFLSILGSRMTGRNTGIYMYTGLVTAVGASIIGVIWALLNLKYTKESEEEEAKIRFDSYGNYLIEIAEDLKQKYDENMRALYDMYPSARDCSTYGLENLNLWNRNSSHDDFLFVRLGVGDIPFQVKIKVPDNKFSIQKDSLKLKPKLLLDEYKTLKKVPVGIDLREKQLWGIVGNSRKTEAIQIMYDIVAQIAANNCYTDVKMAFVYKEKNNRDKEQWLFAKWLPHVWSQDQRTRYVATDEMESKDVFYELANIIRHRSEESSFENKTKIPKPYYVLFVSDASLLEGELLKKYIYEPKAEYGITTFILTNQYEQLPNVCENVIQYDKSICGYYNTMDITGEHQSVRFDDIDVHTLTDMAKRLSEIRVNETESNADIPNSLDFLEMYGANNLEDLQVQERWRKNRTYNTMKALIGKKAGGVDCFLDVHEKYHGPHGLIAGTTGSGKSETLQTYMLSLALNFSPDDIGFLVIDFKGGGMANLFSGLPHMIGQISNLSGNQIRRAMISIKSENMRRQRIFGEYGVNNINLYTRLYKNNETQIPIPHLFIIIDEFAELKREEPDFMREIISVAQVGRSLGVHLILATQKPYGTVDENIWSNSKFRLCLRVQDKQDSNEMLHKPDAAYITQAGRCYMQVGNDEIYELFQSGWSGAVYEENKKEYARELATMLTSTGKIALVGSKARIKQKEEEKRKYYKEIVEIIISSMLATQTLSTENIDDAKLTYLVKNVIVQMNEEGMEYEKSNSNIKRLKDMIQLWPRQQLSSDQIAEYIMVRAALENVRLPEMKEKTQLDAIVEYLKKIADENGYTRNLQLWMPLLPKEMYLESVMENRSDYFDGKRWNRKTSVWNLEVPVGLYDDPENQTQAPLMINFSEGGHLAVCGLVVTGKSTFLQTLMYALAMKYTAEDINIYGLDFSSGMLMPFAKMPQVGGVVDSSDIEGVDKFFHMIGSFMDERKKILGGGNYAQYVKAFGVTIPAIFVVIDNYAGFAEKTENRYADTVMRLAKEGVGYGIFLIMSSGGVGMTEIPTRVADNVRTTICLEMGDKFKYMDILHVTHVPVMPEADVKGRGLANAGGALLEFQTALAFEAEDDYKRNEQMRELAETMSKVWTGKPAFEIPRIPENPVLSEFNEMDKVKELNASTDYIPIAYYQKNASICSILLPKTYCYIISGRAKTGKTTFLKLLMQQASKKNGEMVVFEKGSFELEHDVNQYHAKYLRGDKDLFQWLRDLQPEFIRRNKRKQVYKSEGIDESGIYERMKNETPIFIFISDLSVFINTVYKPEDGVGNMKGFIENIWAKGELHNIYFIAEINSDIAAGLGAYAAYKSFVGYKRGVHLGGNLASQRIFSFSGLQHMEASKGYKKGIGVVPNEEAEDELEKIVIPLYGK